MSRLARRGPAGRASSSGRSSPCSAPSAARAPSAGRRCSTGRSRPRACRRGPRRCPPAASCSRTACTAAASGASAPAARCCTDGSRRRPSADRCARSRGRRRSACGSGSWTRMPLTAGSPFKRVDQRQQLRLRRRRRQVVRERAHADRLGRPALVAHVDLRRRIVADEHDGEARLRPCRRRRGRRRRSAISAVRRWARALPSMMRAVMCCRARAARHSRVASRSANSTRMHGRRDRACGASRSGRAPPRYNAADDSRPHCSGNPRAARRCAGAAATALPAAPRGASRRRVARRSRAPRGSPRMPDVFDVRDDGDRVRRARSTTRRAHRGAGARRARARRRRAAHRVARRALRGGPRLRGAAVVPARARGRALLRHPHLRRARQRPGAPRRRDAMWIARRSPTKAIDPDLLDNLVGGGIAAGQSVPTTVVKEAWEEAGIPADARRASRSRRRGAHLPRAAGRPAARDDLRPRSVAARRLRPGGPGRRGRRAPAGVAGRGGRAHRQRRRAPTSSPRMPRS